MKYKLNYTFLCNLILTNFVVDGFWRLKFITQIYEGEINGHEEKEGLPTEFHYMFEQEMLKHVHDLNKDLREKGWWERDTRGFSNLYSKEWKLRCRIRI